MCEVFLYPYPKSNQLKQLKPNQTKPKQTKPGEGSKFKGYGFALRNETLSWNRKYDFELKDLAAALMLLYLK